MEVEKNMTFFQWLNDYEGITKREYKEFSNTVKENYRREYNMWLKEISQYN